MKDSSFELWILPLPAQPALVLCVCASELCQAPDSTGLSPWNESRQPGAKGWVLPPRGAGGTWILWPPSAPRRKQPLVRKVELSRKETEHEVTLSP